MYGRLQGMRSYSFKNFFRMLIHKEPRLLRFARNDNPYRWIWKLINEMLKRVQHDLKKILISARAATYFTTPQPSVPLERNQYRYPALSQSLSLYASCMIHLRGAVPPEDC